MTKRRTVAITDPRHRALILQAIEDRVAQGIPRAEAATEVLDQEYRWRQEELAAARYSPVDDFFTEVLAPALDRAASRIRRIRRPRGGA